MATRSRRGTSNGLDAWPGYVDALSTLLMVVMFVLLVFVMAQAFESVVLAKRNEQLSSTNATLSTERERNASLTGSVSRLNQTLTEGDAARAALLTQLRDLNAQTAATMSERDKLASLLKELEIASAAAAAMNLDLGGRLTAQTKRADDASRAAELTRREVAAAEARLREMQAQIKQLDQTVSADKATIAARLSDLAKLSEQTAALTALRDQLSKQVSAAAAAAMTEVQRRQAIAAQLEEEKKLGDTARARLALLAQQNDQLRGQLTTTEQQRGDEQIRAASLTSQLNLALAAQVEELRKYRSDFFGKLRAVLADRPGISVVGDRFVFQSEVLFPGGSAEMSAAGATQMADFAATFRKISDEIPADVNWVLRVDGHTDVTPIRTGRFASNWELSAARAIVVVKFLATQGIAARHLAATGFGENQPVDPGDTPEAYAKNRRIEIRLTDR